MKERKKKRRRIESLIPSPREVGEFGYGIRPSPSENGSNAAARGKASTRTLARLVNQLTHAPSRDERDRVLKRERQGRFEGGKEKEEERKKGERAAAVLFWKERSRDWKSATF